ncbi:MAG TPA: hypothetical protein VMO47_04060 [Rhodothermales bacterium]|nr:hypothetical protein [Rhodothermales bacterium]
MSQFVIKAALLAACAITCIETGLSAQSLWTDQSGDRAISVEFLKPEFEGDADTDFLTSTIVLGGRFPISPTIAGEAELPFSRYGIDNEFVDRSDAAVGNPYLGVRIRSRSVVSRIGIRLPIAPDDKPTPLSAGRLTDYDRFEAFLPNVLAVNASVTGQTRLSDQAILQFGGGPVLLVPTEDGGSDDTEVYAQYFLLGVFAGRTVAVKAGFTGRAILTESDLDFGERSIHQFGLGAALNNGTLRPGLHVRIPLDEDLRDSIDYVAGINLTVILD